VRRLAGALNCPSGVAVLRHKALNVTQTDAASDSFGGKVKRAGWDGAYPSRPPARF
jgi:hypothetical protein